MSSNEPPGEHETIYLPPFPTPVKPKRGEPCNGCGWCCHEEICFFGKAFLGVEEPKNTFLRGPCPLIDYKDGRVFCGLVVAEERMKLEAVLKKGLGIGEGCDADDPKSYD